MRRIAALYDLHGNLPALEAWPTAEQFVRERLLTVPAATAAIGYFERMAGRG